jgi:hypothetical protein
MTTSFDHFVGQFVVSRESDAAQRTGWPSCERSGWHLAAHPTAIVADIVSEDGAALGWLVGEPMRDGRLIRDQYRVSTAAPDHELYRVGGPWVAILTSPSSPCIYMDAFGHLPLVYNRHRETAASSPSLVPDVRLDEEFHSFMDIPAQDRWYPFGLTAWRDVMRLLPSHRLDLTTWTVKRCWPDAPPYASLTVDAAAEKLRGIVRDQISALASAYPLQLSLTAGFDSRSLLACARGWAHDMLFVTNDSHPTMAGLDIAAASYFAKRHRLKHVVRRLDDPPSREEREVWLAQTGRSGAGAAFRHLRSTNAYGTERARLSGQGGEVIRAYRKARPKPSARDYDPPELVSTIKLPTHPRIEAAAEAWREGLPECSGDQMLNLLYLEQRIGCWASPLRLGGATGYRAYWPFAHRETAELSLVVPREAQVTSAVHRRLIELEWPELLEIPFNAPFGWTATRVRWQKRLRGVLKRPGI